MAKPRLSLVFFFLLHHTLAFLCPFFFLVNESSSLTHFLPSFFDLCPFLPIPSAVTKSRHWLPLPRRWWLTGLRTACLSPCNWAAMRTKVIRITSSTLQKKVCLFHSVTSVAKFLLCNWYLVFLKTSLNTIKSQQFLAIRCNY